MLTPFLSGFFTTLGGAVAILAIVALPSLFLLIALSLLRKGERHEEVIRIVPDVESRNGFHEDHLLN